MVLRDLHRREFELDIRARGRWAANPSSSTRHRRTMGVALRPDSTSRRSTPQPTDRNTHEQPSPTEPAIISGAHCRRPERPGRTVGHHVTAEQISAINVALVAVLAIFVRQSVTPVKVGDAGDDEGPIVPADPPKLR